MTQRHYRVDVQDSIFPMLSEQMGRTVIGSTKEELYAKDNQPRAYYMHNVMPSKYGLDSVGFLQVIPPAAVETVFVDIREVYGNAKSRMQLAWNTLGEVYALERGASAWVKLAATAPVTAHENFSAEEITLGVVRGISYIYYSKTACFIYNEGTSQLEHVELIGLTISATLGITSTSGYLVAYTEEAIAWSSTILATDFAPSQVTGAAGGNVAGISGAIKFILPNSLGLIVYSETNAVAVTYTGNLRYPFKFREIDNSKGGISLDLVAYEANSASQFVYSKAGLQSVTSQAAENLLPEVTDFLAGKRFEEFNSATAQFIVTDLTTTMKKKVKFIASRYLIISYGIESFTHAIVYDATLEKVGKIKLTHVDCAEYIGEQTEVSKESLAFMLADGSLQLLDFSTKAVSDGVCILGKLQYTRSKMLTLLEVDSENIELSSACTLSDLISLDGKTFTKVEGIEAYTAQNIRKHAFRLTGINHSLLYEGKFNLVSVLVTYMVGGRR